MPKSQEGSATSGIIAGIMVLSMAAVYVSNLVQRNSQALKDIRLNDERTGNSIVHLSNFSMLKAALQTANRKGIHVPGIYPNDYFAETWDLRKNTSVMKDALNPQGSAVKMKVLGNGMHMVSEAGATPSMDKQVYADNGVKILALNHDATFPFWVSSIDAVSSMTVDNKSSKVNARVPLQAPIPWGLKLAIKAPGAADFKIYTAKDDIPDNTASGAYKFRVIASGVVLYSEVTLNGVVHKLGIDANSGKVTHEARNAFATDKVIGEFEVPLESKTTTSTTTTSSSSGGTSSDGGGGESSGGGGDSACQIGTDNASVFSQGLGTVGAGGGTTAGTGTTGSGGGATTTTTTTTKTASVPTEIKLSAKVYGVDGQEATDVTINKSFKVGSSQGSTSVTQSGTTSSNTNNSANKGYENCSEYCPMNIVNDFDNDINNKAKALDRGALTEADYTKVDFYNAARTASTLDTSKIPGIICDNYDRTGMAMFSNQGLLASGILVKDKNVFNAKFGEYASLYQSYIYIAPKCNRTVINNRATCGCFAEDTLILMADGSEVKVRELRQGDWVLNPVSRRPMMIRKVVRGPEKIPMYRIKTHESTLLVTEGHPFRTELGLAPAKLLQKGLKIATPEGSTSIEDIVKVPVPDPAPVVWNIELDGGDDEDDHFVFANGIITGDLYLQQKLQKSP